MSELIVAAFIVVVAGFISVLIVAVLAGQRSQRSQISNLRSQMYELDDRLKTPSERAAYAERVREVEEQNRKNRELYEYGGC